MGTKILFLVFGVIVQFCSVLGRHNFFEHYFSHHHKGHSTTTEPLLSSTSEFLGSSEYERESSPPDYFSWVQSNDMISNPDDNSLQNNMYEVTDDTSLQNQMYEPTVYPFDDNYNTDYSSLRIGVLIAIIVIFLCVVCCLCCCIRHFCRKKERRGFVIANQPETAREVIPQQSALINTPPESQQPYPTQCYDQRSQFLPPYYQPTTQYQAMQQYPPMQPQFQYSPPEMQSHNPPEAPPPYEFPHKF